MPGLLASHLALLNNLGLNVDCLTCMQSSNLALKLVEHVPRSTNRQVPPSWLQFLLVTPGFDPVNRVLGKTVCRQRLGSPNHHRRDGCPASFLGLARYP